MELRTNRSKLRVLVALTSLVVGLGVVGYASVGVAKYGFYVSAGGHPGQLEGGAAPLFLLIGAALVIYGCVELWLHRR
jgi:hypothetical protein